MGGSAVAGDGVVDSVGMGLQRQAARLLALLSLQAGAGAEIRQGTWLEWLQVASSSTDSQLSSHATKALLNLRAVAGRAEHTR